MPGASLSPMMQQYRDAKQAAGDALRAHEGAARIVLGAHHPPVLHAQAAAINAAIGAPEPLTFAPDNRTGGRFETSDNHADA